MTKTKTNIYTIGIMVAIIALIIVRLFMSSPSKHWISTLNFIGLILATISLYTKIIAKCRGNKNAARFVGYFTIIFIIVLLAFFIILALIFAQTITLPSKANDIVFLLTLLFSLPSDELVLLIDKIINKEGLL